MTRIQMRRGTAAAWTAANPVLAAGEWGDETDTGKVKIGNGATAWVTLAYATDAQVDKGSLVFNVRDYGAVGDGSTDDTAAIQAAIDAATAAGGGTVIVPKAGTFIFTSIRVKANVTLAGYGGTLKLKNGVCIDAGVAYYLIHNLDGVGGSYSNVTIRDLILDGNKANNTLAQVADGMTILGENVKVLNNWIKDPPDSGIMFSKVTNSVCSGNRIQDGRDVGIYVNDGDGTHMYESVISNNKITGFPFGGIAVKRIGQRIIIAENTIYNCGNGITLENGSTAVDYSTNCSIVNNRIRYIGYIEATAAKRGIELRFSDHAIVTGNRIEDVETRGILVAGSTYSVVSNNIISLEATSDATTGIGIDVMERDAQATTHTVISDNVITGGGNRGISLAGTVASSYNHVSGNIAIGATNQGMYVASTWTNNIITGNVLSSAGNDLSYIPAAGANVWANNRLINGTIAGGIILNSMTDTPEQIRSGGNIYSNYGDATYATKLGNTGQGASAIQLNDVSIFRASTTTLQLQSGKNLKIDTGAWNSGRIFMGAYQLWVDGSGRLKIKSGAPANDADGTIVGTQS